MGAARAKCGGRSRWRNRRCRPASIVRHHRVQAGMDVLAREAARLRGLERVEPRAGAGRLVAQRHRQGRPVAAVAVRFVQMPPIFSSAGMPSSRKRSRELRQVASTALSKRPALPFTARSMNSLARAPPGGSPRRCAPDPSAGCTTSRPAPCRLRGLPPCGHPFAEQFAVLRALFRAHGVVNPVIHQPLPAEMTGQARFLPLRLPPDIEHLAAKGCHRARVRAQSAMRALLP